ncbi:hypothetical protein [Streptomyces sp. A2-16]|uniref:hypothetical protein n=1 Tax=Streptomyces sp. A2-16 TaxID=2781734 RepID=UPI002010EEFE|nr:hypothetical protein [Streptomyces sp. A2-16]
MKRLSGGKPRVGGNALLVLGALCALTLTACGTERAGDGDLRGEPAGRAGATSATPLPAGSAAPEDTAAEDTAPGDTEGPDFLPFMERLLSLAEPCGGDLPTAPPEVPEEGPEPPQFTGPPPTLLPEPPLPEDEPPPSAESRDHSAAARETELGSVEKCTARIHGRRITEALADTPAPTPRQVRRTLHDLGYIDERIHGPRRSGEQVKFTLDLRLLGGELCLDGTTGPGGTVVESYGGSPEVECLEVRRPH